MKNIFFILLFFLFLVRHSFGQSARELNREGIEHYNQGQFEKAEERYKQALKRNSKLVEASYNLTLTFYKQEKYNEAIIQMKKVLSQTSDKNILSKLYHNMGNSYLKINKLKESIDSYQNSLRINPQDEETRYNLTYALLKYKASQRNKEQNTQDLLDKIEQEENFSQRFMRRDKNRGKEIKNW